MTANSIVPLLLLSLLIVSSTFQNSAAFTPIQQQHHHVGALSSSVLHRDPDTKPSAFHLADMDNLAGNMGFDPLQLAQSRNDVMVYREAEMKHARLAMLVAAGWTVAELYNNNNMYPTVVPDTALWKMGTMFESTSPIVWGFCLGLSAAIELYGTTKAADRNSDYWPGKLGFDPLQLYTTRNETGQRRLELAEIANGRLAMMAMAIGVVVRENASSIVLSVSTPQ